MERIASAEEKIRRAEEIYYRRKSQNGGRNVATVNVNSEKNYGLFKKLILQILICLVIYFIFYIIQNGNYIFSTDVINKTKEILSYDINIPETYQQIMQYMNQSVSQEGQSSEENNIDTNQINNEQIENNVENNGEDSVENSIQNDTIDNTINEVTNTAAIGGADVEDVVMEEEVPKTQDELDIEYLKTYSWVRPVSGVVSSEYGTRESTNPIVGTNHVGIDIAANTGTVIVAALEGTVTISSTVGEYGYHIKITNNDVSTLYAHCSKLYVQEGEYIAQGQAIAEVGSTGKSTGPHLHFEVIRENRYINPRNVIEF